MFILVSCIENNVDHQNIFLKFNFCIFGKYNYENNVDHHKLFLYLLKIYKKLKDHPPCCCNPGEEK